MTYDNHESAVRAFFLARRDEDPARFAEVMAAYPVQSFRKKSRRRKKELTAGLLGLEASPISKHEAQLFGLESIYMSDSDDDDG